MEKLNELNRLLTRFNFTHKDLFDFENHIEHTLKKLPASKIKIKKGRAIYRCRKYNLPIKSLFYFESDLSFRTDLGNISSFGRCNVKNDSVFYGSIYSNPNRKTSINNKPQMVDPGYMTAIFETTTLLDPPKSTKVSEGVEIYGVGMWEATEDLDVFIMPPDEIWQGKSELADELLETHEKNMMQANASKEIREFYNIMGVEFSKYMHDKPNDEYGISALFSANTLRSAGGVAYSSVKMEHNGFNIALTPDTIESKFKFIRAGIGELWKFGKEMYFRFTSESERAQGIPLVYNHIGVPKFSVEEMIAYYENKGIDRNHIVEVLIGCNYLKV
jgi:hypothetical protein